MSDHGFFFTEFAGDAKNVSGSVGILPSVILAQWADETGYGQTLSGPDVWNFGGIGGSGGLQSYPDKQSGLDGYIRTINLGFYNAVRSAQGWQAQAVALGNSPWDTTHYNHSGGGPGSDLIDIINSNNLTQYDAGSSAGGGVSPVGSLGATVGPPPSGMGSSISQASFFLNGTQMDVNVSGSLSNVSLDLTIDGASTLQLVLHDPPPRQLINHPDLNQKSSLTLDGQTWELVAVTKQGSVVTVTFEPWVVAALRQATGALTVAPGTMTRTQFAAMLVSQVTGASFAAPTDAQLENILSVTTFSVAAETDATVPEFQSNTGYAQPTQETLSRGTWDQPLEDSWTCLQRIATEIQWRCFEVYGTVYFGPDAWLMLQPAAMTAAEFTGGVQTIDGDWDIGQPLGTCTVNCVAGSWTPAAGQVVNVVGVGPLSGNWLVSQMQRDSVFLPDIAVTLTQPQPELPEPKDQQGARAAVGAGFGQPGNQQTQGGTAAAAAAVQYAQGQLGVRYTWGGTSPATGFDCSGLVQAAYAAVGVNIPRTSEQQFAGAGQPVPDGWVNLRLGDLVFFGNGSDASHVGIVSLVRNDGTAQMIDAPHTGAVVRYDDFTVQIGAPWGSDRYMGARRPSQ